MSENIEKTEPAKLGEKTVLALVQIGEKIKKLQETQSSMLKKIVEKHGESVGHVKLDQPDENGYQYVKVTVSDNLEKFKAGEPVYKSTGISRYSIDTRKLKNEPK